MGTGQGTTPHERVRAETRTRPGRLGRLYASAIAPRAASEEARQREVVLNVFLAGSIALGALVLAMVTTQTLTHDGSWLAAVRIARVAAWTGICALLLRSSRAGHPRRATIGLLTLYTGICFIAAAAWSLMLPATFGVAMLLIVLSVVLLEGRAALLACVGVIGGLALLDILQQTGVVDVYDEWLTDPRTFFDSFVVLVFLAVLAGISLQLRREPTTPISEFGASASPLNPQLRERTLEWTLREVQVSKLVAEGLKNAEIAERLYLSIRTVHSHIESARRKSGCANRTDLGVLAVRTGIAPLDPLNPPPDERDDQQQMPPAATAAHGASEPRSDGRR